MPPSNLLHYGGSRARLVALGLIAPLSLGLALATPRVAVAQDVRCTTPYSTDRLLDELMALEKLLQTGDPSSWPAGRTLEHNIGCLSEVLPTVAASQVLSRVYRAIASAYVTGGDRARAEEWLRSARGLNPSFDYGADEIPLNHPVRDLWAAVKGGGEIPVMVAKGSLGGGRHLLDGKPITTPRAAAGPHVYQLVAEGQPVRAWVIEGSAFPTEAFASGPVASASSDPKPGKPAKPAKPARAPKPASDDASPRGLLIEVAGGLALASVDRAADIRVSPEGDWYQEGPVSGMRPRFELRLAVAPVTAIDFGLAVGIHPSGTEITTREADEHGPIGALTLEEDGRLTPYVQARLRAGPLQGGFRPWVLAGLDLTFLGPVELEGWPTVPGGVLPGIVLGGGATIDLVDHLALFVEGSAIPRLGARARASQAGPVPLGRPNLPQEGPPLGASVVLGIQVNP